MKKLFTLLILISFCGSLKAQYTTIPKKSKRESYVDSLTKVKYPYVFPALGQKVRSKGIDFPLPHGIMINAVYTKQDLKLTDLQVGFNSSELFNLDSVVVFDHITADGIITNLRFDTYIFPFLDVYGLAGTMNGHTEVQLIHPINFSTTTSNPGQYYGFGTMLSGGFGSFWVTSDINFAWTSLVLLDHPVKTRIIGLRAGRVFHFEKKPYQNVAIWVAAQNQKIFNETSGQISYKDLGLDGDKLNDLQTQLDNWYAALSPADQRLYQNVYTKLSNGFSTAEGTIETGYVRYHFNKSLYTPWHYSVGGQWQINPHWQLRGEIGGAYKKQQYLLSMGYRFGIKGRNIMSGEGKSVK